MLTRTRHFAIVLAALLLGALSCPPARAGSDLGVVVLHGLTGGPGDRPTGPFLQALRNAGYPTRAPEMCWSRGRVFDMVLPDCLHEIDAAVAALRAAGARRIVVAGQSLGGMAAIVYGTQHPELAGVVALAPAGNPEQLNRNPQVAESVARARQMIAAGQGAVRSTFTDVNMGETLTVAATPLVYLSFVEPGGPADFPRLLPELRVPIVWVAGSMDRTQRGADALYARLPANPLNRFIQVTAVHLDTPAAGAGTVLDWLKTLPAQ
jgi:pimeloyl-ACP methyl ester carboxylesterase